MNIVIKLWHLFSLSDCNGSFKDSSSSAPQYWETTFEKIREAKMVTKEGKKINQCS